MITILIIYLFIFGQLAISRTGYPHLKIRYYPAEKLYQTGTTSSDIVYNPYYHKKIYNVERGID